MTYDTGNPVPSTDPRDLDDNAEVFDELMHSTASSVADRTGVQRKTWHQVEIDASALVSPNVASLGGLTLAANKGLYATGPGALATFDLAAQGRTFLAATTTAAQLTALGALAASVFAAAGFAASDPPLLTNMNSPVSGGLNKWDNLTTNAPSVGASPLGVVLTARYSATGFAQMAVALGPALSVNRVFFRSCVAGVWGAWEEVVKGGANSSITSLTGLTTALSIAQGGTGNINGSAVSLTTSRSIAATGDATWSVNFNGSANATGAITLAASGVGAGTYGSVTVNAKGLVTAATTATPVANGGTGATTATAAGTNLGTAVVGTNTDQLARSSMIQAEIANKRAWTAYTPTLTATTGTFTSAAATGTYMVAFGICHVRIRVTVTTKGTGTLPKVTLPFPALAGHDGNPLPARENNLTGSMGVARIQTGLTGLDVFRYDTTDLITADGCVVVISGSYPIA